MDAIGVSGRLKRVHRFRGVSEKRGIVEETLQAGVSVSSVARAHGINANQVFQWRKLYQEGLLEVAVGDGMPLLPVAVADDEGTSSGANAQPTTKTEAASVCSSTGTIELSLGWGQLRIIGAVDGETLRTVLGCLLT